MKSGNQLKIAGGLYLLAFASGIFSVAPAADAADYLSQVAAHKYQVIVAAFFQFIISLCYGGIAALFYPVIKAYGRAEAAGFLSCRIIAVVLSLLATVILLAMVPLSQTYLQSAPQDAALPAIGAVLKTSRDALNHVLMIGVLCTGNVLLYFLLIRAAWFPRWLAYWGIGANILSVVASLFVLFQAIGIITATYLALNLPTALQELVLGVWLLVKGGNRRQQPPGITGFRG